MRPVSSLARFFSVLMSLAVTVVAWTIPSNDAAAADDTADPQVEIGGGAYHMAAPKDWVRKTPASRIVEYEFEIPAAKGDERAGRAIIMGAGGSIEANLDRWYGQFKQPDGAQTKDRAKVEKIEVAGQQVHMVDISGTYNDRPPFAGADLFREHYRMLAAIITTKDAGNYYLKFYGPERTVTANEKAFEEMVKSLESR